jgi:hypothetical protein
LGRLSPGQAVAVQALLEYVCSSNPELSGSEPRRPRPRKEIAENTADRCLERPSHYRFAHQWQKWIVQDGGRNLRNEEHLQEIAITATLDGIVNIRQ